MSTGRLSGVNNSTLDHVYNEIDPNLLCHECKYLVIFPVECPSCQYLICQGCAQNKDCVCSECGNTFTKQPGKIHKLFKQKLQSLEFKCPNFNSLGLSCKKIINYENLDQHLQSQCDARLKPCPNRCSKVRKLYNMEEFKKHLDEDCPNEAVPCPRCKRIKSRSEVQNHLKIECEMAIITCQICKRTDMRKVFKQNKHQCQQNDQSLIGLTPQNKKLEFSNKLNFEQENSFQGRASDLLSEFTTIRPGSSASSMRGIVQPSPKGHAALNSLNSIAIQVKLLKDDMQGMQNLVTDNVFSMIDDLNRNLANQVINIENKRIEQEKISKIKDDEIKNNKDKMKQLEIDLNISFQQLDKIKEKHQFDVADLRDQVQQLLDLLGKQVKDDEKCYQYLRTQLKQQQLKNEELDINVKTLNNIILSQEKQYNQQIEVLIKRIEQKEQRYQILEEKFDKFIILNESRREQDISYLLEKITGSQIKHQSINDYIQQAVAQEIKNISQRQAISESQIKNIKVPPINLDYLKTQQLSQAEEQIVEMPLKKAQDMGVDEPDMAFNDESNEKLDNALDLTLTELNTEYNSVRYGLTELNTEFNSSRQTDRDINDFQASVSLNKNETKFNTRQTSARQVKGANSQRAKPAPGGGLTDRGKNVQLNSNNNSSQKAMSDNSSLQISQSTYANKVQNWKEIENSPEKKMLGKKEKNSVGVSMAIPESQGLQSQDQKNEVRNSMHAELTKQSDNFSDNQSFKNESEFTNFIVPDQKQFQIAENDEIIEPSDIILSETPQVEKSGKQDQNWNPFSNKEADEVQNFQGNDIQRLSLVSRPSVVYSEKFMKTSDSSEIYQGLMEMPSNIFDYGQPKELQKEDEVFDEMEKQTQDLLDLFVNSDQVQMIHSKTVKIQKNRGPNAIQKADDNHSDKSEQITVNQKLDITDTNLNEDEEDQFDREEEYRNVAQIIESDLETIMETDQESTCFTTARQIKNDPNQDLNLQEPGIQFIDENAYNTYRLGKEIKSMGQDMYVMKSVDVAFGNPSLLRSDKNSRTTENESAVTKSISTQQVLSDISPIVGFRKKSDDQADEQNDFYDDSHYTNILDSTVSRKFLKQNGVRISLVSENNNLINDETRERKRTILDELGSPKGRVEEPSFIDESPASIEQEIRVRQVQSYKQSVIDKITKSAQKRANDSKNEFVKLSVSLTSLLNVSQNIEDSPTH